jgi:hypothetical protein
MLTCIHHLPKLEKLWNFKGGYSLSKIWGKTAKSENWIV